MAVVFISPKKRLKLFFVVTTIGFALFLGLVAFWVFLSQPQGVAPEIVFNKEKISINLAVLDGKQFKNLEPFPEFEMQYEYTATDSKSKKVSGLVSAMSLSKAEEKLKTMGLKDVSIKEIKIGRENPFIPY